MSRWSERTDVPRGASYDERWRELEAKGVSIHGEADLVAWLAPGGSVLDAGCGTGRVAIELARRGHEIVGVDLDRGMLGAARDKAPDLEWVEADLVDVDLRRTFDVVAAPGNVMIFVAPGTEAEVVANLARHVAPRGVLVAGFQLSADRLSIEEYDRHAGAVGFELQDRWSTWDREPFVPGPGAGYAVSVHRRS